jgi:hypothetical protein
VPASTAWCYARYLYFGVDLAALDLTTFEVLLHGAEALYVPIAALLILALGTFLTIRGARRLMERGRNRRLLLVLSIITVVLGTAALVRGAIGVVVPTVSQHEFPGTTATGLGISLALIHGGTRMLRSTKSKTPRRPRKRGTTDVIVTTCSLAMAVLGLFWATNSFAAAYGRGLAEATAEQLTSSRPTVIIDTEERLYSTVPEITETALPVAEGQKFKYRYRGLHLLTEAGGRLFLVSGADKGRSGTIVLPYNDSVRIQFTPAK